MNYYILVFEREPQKSYKAFHQEFVAHEQIHNWWHFLKPCYLAVTDLDASDLSKHAKEILEKNWLRTTHLVLEANLPYRSGWLPKEAWSWLRENAAGQWKGLNPEEDEG